MSRLVHSATASGNALLGRFLRERLSASELLSAAQAEVRRISRISPRTKFTSLVRVFNCSGVGLYSFAQKWISRGNVGFYGIPCFSWEPRGGSDFQGRALDLWHRLYDFQC